MREIDLIPREHVQQRRVRRALRQAAFAGAALLASIAAARLALGVAIAQQRPVIDQLRQDEHAASRLRARLAELSARKSAADARLAAWQRLQEPAPWRHALGRIDGAFGRGLWFDQLSLLHSAPAAAGTGEPGALPRHLAVQVKGHALDHAALTAFTRALSEQPGLRGVRLLDTSLRRYSMADVVDFTVASRLEPPQGGPP